MEFATTTSYEPSAAPVSPDGEGWMLAGVVGENIPSHPSMPSHGPPTIVVYFYWQRDKSKVAVEPCTKCRAISRKDGACVGCGTAVS